MNKFKFFGSTLMAAFFAFSLASCEKEDFKTDVDIDVPEVEIPEVEVPEGYKPGDAVIAIQPTVWATIDGVTKNVTAESTITYNGSDKFTYTVNADKGISAMTVEIEAAYDVVDGEETKTLTASVTLNIPALSAGQVLTFNPSLFVTYKSEGNTPDDPDQPGGEDPEDPNQPGGNTPSNPTFEQVAKVINEREEVKHFHYENATNYYYDEYKLGAKILVSDVISVSYGSWENTLKPIVTEYEDKYEDKIFGTYTLYANSITCVEYKAKYVQYEVTMKARSGEEAKVVYEVKEQEEFKVYTGLALNNGTGHSHAGGNVGHSHGHGNGHDHGHGLDNAGGGIVYPM